MTELARLSGRTTSQGDVVAALSKDGGVILEDFLSDEVLDGLRADLLPQLERQSVGRDSFSGDHTRRLSRLFARTRHCAAIATHPLFLPVAKHFLCAPRTGWVGERRRTQIPDIRIGVTQAIQIGPGQVAQPLHRDDAAFLWPHPTHGVEGRVQIICAISDFTAENGGTLVIPGSHLWSDDRMPKHSEAISTEMRAGSALIFLGSTFHGGGANITKDEVRSAVSIALDVSHVRQEENMYLSLTPAEVASYPEPIQRLLGWSAGSNHMGWVEVDGQMIDPIHLLSEIDPASIRGVGARNP